MFNITNELESFFDSNEMEQFKSMKNSEETHIEHPIMYLLKEKREACWNTELAFKLTSTYDNRYYSKIKESIAKEQNYSSINGYLGEIRCYGYLLKCFDENIIVKPIRTKKVKTPDFEVTNTLNNQKVYIEVHTKQCNKDESKRLFEYRKNLNIKEKKYDVTSLAPFGRSKDHINIDVIQKLAQIKEEKHQIPENSIGILWIDLQSEDIGNMLGIYQAAPLWYNENYGMFSGVLWYALYGKKKLPIFNSSQFNLAYEGMENFQTMGHDGLFLQRQDFSAVIVSNSKYTLFFENPFSKDKIPMWFIEKIINVHRLDYTYSKIPFPIHDIKKEIEDTYMKIESLSKIPNISFDYKLKGERK